MLGIKRSSHLLTLHTGQQQQSTRVACGIIIIIVRYVTAAPLFLLLFIGDVEHHLPSRASLSFFFFENSNMGPICGVSALLRIISRSPPSSKRLGAVPSLGVFSSSSFANSFFFWWAAANVIKPESKAKRTTTAAVRASVLYFYGLANRATSLVDRAQPIKIQKRSDQRQ